MTTRVPSSRLEADLTNVIINSRRCLTFSISGF